MAYFKARVGGTAKKKPIYVKIVTAYNGGAYTSGYSWIADADGYVAIASNRTTVSLIFKINGVAVAHDSSVTIHNASWNTDYGLVIKIKKGDTITESASGGTPVYGTELFFIYTDEPITDIYMAVPVGAYNGGYVTASFTITDFDEAMVFGATIKIVGGSVDYISMSGSGSWVNFQNAVKNGTLLDNDYIMIYNDAFYYGGMNKAYKNDVITVNTYTNASQNSFSSGAAIAIKTA